MGVKKGEVHCTFNFPEIVIDFLKVMQKEKIIPNLSEGVRMAVRYYFKENKKAIEEVQKFG